MKSCSSFSRLFFFMNCLFCTKMFSMDPGLERLRFVNDLQFVGAPRQSLNVGVIFDENFDECIRDYSEWINIARYEEGGRDAAMYCGLISASITVPLYTEFFCPPLRWVVYPLVGWLIRRLYLIRESDRIIADNNISEQEAWIEQLKNAREKWLSRHGMGG